MKKFTINYPLAALGVQLSQALLHACDRGVETHWLTVNILDMLLWRMQIVGEGVSSQPCTHAY